MLPIVHLNQHSLVWINSRFRKSCWTNEFLIAELGFLNKFTQQNNYNNCKGEFADSNDGEFFKF